MIDVTKEYEMTMARLMIKEFIGMYEDYHGKFDKFNLSFHLADDEDVIGEVKLGYDAFDVISFVQLFEGKDEAVRELYEWVSEEYRGYLVTIERKG